MKKDRQKTFKSTGWFWIYTNFIEQKYKYKDKLSIGAKKLTIRKETDWRSRILDKYTIKSYIKTATKRWTYKSRTESLQYRTIL